MPFHTARKRNKSKKKTAPLGTTGGGTMGMGSKTLSRETETDMGKSGGFSKDFKKENFG